VEKFKARNYQYSRLTLNIDCTPS